MDHALDDNVQRQIKLEDQSVEAGVRRYRKLVAAQDEADLMPGSFLLSRSIGPLSAAIKKWVEDTIAGNAGKGARLCDLISALEPDAVAYITARRAMSAIITRDRLVTVALDIGGGLRDELEHRNFKTGAPALYRHVWKDLKKRYAASGHQRRFIMNMARRRAGIKDTPWSRAERAQIGKFLLELMAETTGLIELVRTTEGINDTPIYIHGTEAAQEWIVKRHAQCELLTPVYLPMVVPPVPWTTPFDGGYLTLRRPKLVKTNNRAYLAELSAVTMPTVYRAVNALQDTRWRINTSVLDVINMAWQSGGNIADLPATENDPMPARPAEFTVDDVARTSEDMAAIKDWKRRAAEVHTANAKAVSQRIALSTKLALATQFRDEEAIYFPHVLDWRGRAYPLPALLQPQGDDVARSLLHFADAKPLGENGAYWLAVHIANLFGIDKVPFDTRVEWVEAHHTELLDSALRPLDGRRFWTTADSGKMWQALAACYEWMGYTMAGDAYESRIPIAFDGSCNGLQNFSAMLRDEVGGRATNLLATDDPQDIYTEVSELVVKRVEEDCAGGHELALAWLGKVTRGLIKQAVMTTPYGVTAIGMRDQIMSQMLKLRKAGTPIEGDAYTLASYIQPITSDAIDSTVVAARVAMEWLKQVARLVAKNDLPVYWTSPAGFPVLQEYRQSILKKVDTHLGTTRMQIVVEMDTDTLDRRRQAAGIAPNFVHSLDAAHMMGTINLCLDEDITNFAMIHDSYATHAADSDALSHLLRVAFVNQYKSDQLLEFRDQLAAGLPEELVRQLPPLPAHGTLDISRVLEADYFFA